MTIKKTTEDFKKLTGHSLGFYSQLQYLDILKDDETNEYFMNIFKSYYVNVPKFVESYMYDLYQVDHNEWWENISYKLYGSVKIWWILPLINNVLNPFEYLETGLEIKILKPEYLNIIISNLIEVKLNNGG